MDEHCNFALFHQSRNIGIGFKTTDDEGDVRLFWIKLRDLFRFGNDWQEKIMGALRSVAVPPGRYGDYPCLSPGETFVHDDSHRRAWQRQK